MVAMHDEPSGGDWDEILEAGLDPILGLDSVEADPLCDGLAGGLADDLTDQRLVRRVGKMHGDIPAPVRPLEGGDRGRVFQERALGEGLGEDVDHAFGGLFAADRNAGTVGGGGEGWGHRAIDAFSLNLSEYLLVLSVKLTDGAFTQL